MTYAYIKTKVKVISMDELDAVQNAYDEAKKNKQEWIMQALDKVFEDVDLGRILIREGA
jgi:hypothetical protein|tara:strand:+ start:550 stop:726 length:177 start_codon:yes stop_codon:yes gene_type:complete